MNTVQTAPTAVCNAHVGDCAQLSANAHACLTALRACASARRIDLMARTGLTREAVARAVQDLLEARLARSINGGARYAAREKAA